MIMASKTITPVQEKIIDLEIEKSKLNREKSMLVLNKAIFLYFSFLFVGVVGFINGYLNKGLLNLLILMGLCVLVIGVVPYIRTMHHEERSLEALIAGLKEGGMRSGSARKRG
ncbi:hypothetical protein JXB02_04960 [Candidatus Woesearchaeota archaeon]|nr:hypothetical protein [Candidatus Woesearchaeota archaeon]